MDILEQIFRYKQKEVRDRQDAIPVKNLERSAHFFRTANSFRQALADPVSTGIIAEFKRKSPAKGLINGDVDVQKVTIDYVHAGASALSVLTDSPFFGGSSEDLDRIRETCPVPVLRKDFIIEEYQVLEARAIGADVILLIAAMLPVQKIKQLAALACSLGLEVLLELHSRSELAALNPDIHAVGVNNRNLKTFHVDLQCSEMLFPYLPETMIRISESGIHKPADVTRLKDVGFDGFLIGELFMRTPDPGKALAAFIKAIGK